MPSINQIPYENKVTCKLSLSFFSYPSKTRCPMFVQMISLFFADNFVEKVIWKQTQTFVSKLITQTFVCLEKMEIKIINQE